MAGIKLRMPPGEFWQFLGESIGANPTPVAFAELYTALQSGAVDGQDNPLVSGRTMKFYEVTSQFVLTSHVIGYDVLAVSKKAWERLTPGAAGQVAGAKPTGFSTQARPSTTRRRRTPSSSSRRKASRSTRPTRPPSAPSRRRSTSTSTPTTGRRARSSASTRSSSASLLARAAGRRPASSLKLLNRIGSDR